MNTDERAGLATVLLGQAALNEKVARMLEGVALTADRFDAELAEIRDGMVALSNRIEAVMRSVKAAHDQAAEMDAVHRLPVALTSVETLDRERGL